MWKESESSTDKEQGILPFGGYFTLSTNSIDAQLMAKMFLAGARNLESKKEWLNELNVFPVPDGDTGTNMSLTIKSAADEVKGLESVTLETVSKAISSGSLRGARGNSGVILSQLFRGCSKVWRNEEEITPKNTAAAFQKAVETAYKAVMKPKEGTILTVARGGATKACELVEENPDIEISDLLSQTIRYMDEVLNQTPEMLPVLKEAGVVDSGGQGLVQILKGCLNGFFGIEEEEEEKEEVRKFNYRVEYILNCAKHISKEERLKFVGFLESIGADVAAERCDQGLKVYLNTDDPGAALTKATEYGTMSRIHVINNIDRPVYPLHLFDEKELEEALKNPEEDSEPETASQPDEEGNSSEAAAAGLAAAPGGAAPAPHKDVGFVAVSIGEGLGGIFRDLGVDCLIEGGQTMNPSTEDVMNAVAKVNADTVFILPNNKNIILAAQQAQNLIHDKKIIVIPTKTIPQGITAMIDYMPDKTPAENETAMREEILAVKTVELTYAVRDTRIGDNVIHSGDIMGVGDHGIIAVGKEVDDTAVASLKKMVDSDSELISVYYGKEMSEEKAQALGEKLGEAFPDCDVEVNAGGQPIYYYIISVE